MVIVGFPEGICVYSIIYIYMIYVRCEINSNVNQHPDYNYYTTLKETH